MAVANTFKDTKPPWVHIQAIPWREAETTWNQLTGKDSLAVRVVRGRKCRTTAEFFDEMAAALQFPVDFGENWDALNDCLCDLAWLHCEGVVLVIHDADRLLEAAPAAEWPKFATVVEHVVKEWNQGKKPRPFHVALHVAPGKEERLLELCQTGGLKVKALTKRH